MPILRLIVRFLLFYYDGSTFCCRRAIGGGCSNEARAEGMENAGAESFNTDEEGPKA